MIKMINNKSNENIRDYPKLIQGNVSGKIILQISKNTGYVLAPGKSLMSVGTEICGSFDDDCHSDYNEPVTIQNI